MAQTRPYFGPRGNGSFIEPALNFFDQQYGWLNIERNAVSKRCFDNFSLVQRTRIASEPSSNHALEPKSHRKYDGFSFIYSISLCY